jgi:preprotein translocase subunit SecA
MCSVARALRPPGGTYPERTTEDGTGLDTLLAGVTGPVSRIWHSRAPRFRAIVGAVAAHDVELRSLSDDELAWQVPGLRRELRARGFTLAGAGRAFAMVREVAGRTLGERHFDVQLVGGWVLLNGMVAEMATGEGKTLTATLPACAAALAGVPVHVVTVNDYLTRRDATWMRPIYEALGLTVGAVTNGSSPDERREAYRADVCYCTNKEIVFDYLRDRLEIGPRPGPIRMRLERLAEASARGDRLRLQGLCFAIVDEADAVLIDEARTPLIISGRGDDTYEAELYRQALALAEELAIGTHCFVDFSQRRAELTDLGRERLAELGRELGGLWSGKRHREELVRKALTARHLFVRDKHYVVKQGRVQIVDEYTGRVLAGRSWEGGLHQLVEAKECCSITARTEILGRISYQRFFRRYLALAGMTGTAREAARELWSVYRLPVVAVPTHRPTIRRQLRSRMLPDANAKWEAVVRRIAELHAAGRPVLVGTRTVADSERLARELAAAGLACRVLNAIQDREEAEVIARAGERGQITVATNMAGRGTDIKLGAGVRELGGLHVIATERHDARRIDRQLFGRCGRQGDPGTCEAFMSLEDELLVQHPVRILGPLGRRRADPRSILGRGLGRLLLRAAQRAAEREHSRARRELLRLDASLEASLAFSGRGE